MLLLEAGGRDNWIWFHIPVGYLYAIGNPRADWMFKTEPEPGLNGRSLNYPRGKVLGGSSAINGMIYMLGQATDYDQWRQLGLPGWSWDDVRPFFRKHVDHFIKGDAHAAGGEWRVEQQRLSWEILEAFRAAAVQYGIPAVTISTPATTKASAISTSTSGAAGAGRRRAAFSGRCCTGRTFALNPAVWPRRSSSRAAAPPACASGRTAYCAAPERAARSFSRPARSARRTCSCCRASARRRISREHGIPLLLDKPGVGANLQDHLQLRTIFKVSGVKTLNAMSASAFGKLTMGMDYVFRRRGPMTMAPSQLGAFTKSDPGQDRANIQYHVQPLSLDRFGEPLHAFPAFTASVANVRPTSRGTLTLRSGDPAAAPKIAPNYLSTPEDRRVAADSIRVTRAIVAQPALRKYAPVEYLPGTGISSDDEAALGESRRRYRHHDFPSGRHRAHGPRRRCARGGRCAAARHRHRRPARHRRLGDAVDHLGQHQLADHDDRGEGRRDDCGGWEVALTDQVPATTLNPSP